MGWGGRRSFTRRRITREVELAASRFIHASYIFGLQVIGQAEASATYYLLLDGHGSTAALTGTTGTPVEEYAYSALGKAIGFDANTAKTNWLFGGDGIWDAKSQMTYHLARWRDGHRFVSYDSFEADPSSPAALHKYLYANADPVHGSDPSGRFECSLVGLLGAIGIHTIEQGYDVQRVATQAQAVIDVGTVALTAAVSLEWWRLADADMISREGPLAGEPPSAMVLTAGAGVALPLLGSNMLSTLGITSAGIYYAATLDLVWLRNDPSSVHVFTSDQWGLATGGGFASLELGPAWDVNTPADYAGAFYSSFFSINQAFLAGSGRPAQFLFGAGRGLAGGLYFGEPSMSGIPYGFLLGGNVSTWGIGFGASRGSYEYKGRLPVASILGGFVPAFTTQPGTILESLGRLMPRA